MNRESVKDYLQDVRRKLNYWHWFLKGSGGQPGYKRLLNKWIFFHTAVGIGLALGVPVCLEQAANAVLIPLSGIFIGLAFAWAVNSQALIQSPEIQELAKHHKGGLPEYAFTYQTAIFVILVTLVFWGLAGLKVFDARWPTPSNPYCYFVTKVFLFTLSSITLRECWHVVIGTHWMLLIQQEMKRQKERDNR
ncbi:MAG: hypothetical protein AB1426_11795 [Bacillota bacterium]